MNKNKYVELKEKHQKEFNEFPMFFAFSNEQFEEGMKSFGLQLNELDKIYKMGSTGGYYKREDSSKLNEMLIRQDNEVEEARKDNEYLFQMFKYELSNHEYGYTGDLEETLEALGLTIEKINNDEKLLNALNKAVEIFREEDEEEE